MQEKSATSGIETVGVGDCVSGSSDGATSRVGKLVSADVASARGGYWHAIFRPAHRRQAGMAKSHLRLALVQAAQDLRLGGGLRLSSVVIDIMSRVCVANQTTHAKRKYVS